MIVNYIIEKNNNVYTGYCPDIPAVRFSDSNKDKVKELVIDGIELYMKLHPTYFDSFHSYKM